MKSKKPNILIVCDYPNSVYDRVSNGFMNELSHAFNFTKIYTVHDPFIDHSMYDVIYLMWWRSKIWEDFYIPKEKLCIYVASFWSWQEKFKTSLKELADQYLSHAQCVSVNCPGLFELISPYHPCVLMNPGGVDINKFSAQQHCSTESSEPLKVGWAGSAITHAYNKGYHEIIVPACAKLRGVQLISRVQEINPINYDEMPAFYKGIDVYVCASITEGTPNPVLEAAASSRAVISTPVGIVPLLIEDGYNGYIVERSISQIRDKLVFLRDNRELCSEMGSRNRTRIEMGGWSWKNRAIGYQQMFSEVILKGKI